MTYSQSVSCISAVTHRSLMCVRLKGSDCELLNLSYVYILRFIMSFKNYDLPLIYYNFMDMYSIYILFIYI